MAGPTCMPQQTVQNDNGNQWAFCPSLPAAILFTVLFAITTAVHIFLARKYRTKFAWAIIMGSLWECVSFLIRNISIYNPTSQAIYTPWFLLFLLAPLWINAFDYMLLGRMVFQYLPDQKLFGIRAQRMALCWVLLDIVSFIVQIGGGLLVVSDNLHTKQIGLHIYTAGLALQQFFILVFAFLVFTFQKRMKREGAAEHQKPAKKLVITLFCSLTLISIRIIYRLLEFASEFTSPLTQELWNHEAYQYCLDAVPMLLALIVMIVIHPGTILPGDLSTFKPLTLPTQQNSREKDGTATSSMEG